MVRKKPLIAAEFVGRGSVSGSGVLRDGWTVEFLLAAFWKVEVLANYYGAGPGFRVVV